MDGPWGIRTHKRNGVEDIKGALKNLLAVAFPILFAVLMLWAFGRL